MKPGDSDDFGFDFGEGEMAARLASSRELADDLDFDFGFVEGSVRARSGSGRSAHASMASPRDEEDVSVRVTSAGEHDDGFEFDFHDDTDELPVTPALTGPLRVLTVCSHNRTRSVMSMAMLQDGFDRALGHGAVIVRSLGFGPEGIAPIPDAVEAMERRGLDVSGHRSRQVTAVRLESVDLVLTSERDHVVRVAALDHDAFQRTFTLPEFCQRLAFDPARGERSFVEWMGSLSRSRSASEYLSTEVPEISDPTGSPRRQFEAATAGIETMCATVVEIVGRAIG